MPVISNLYHHRGGRTKHAYIILTKTKIQQFRILVTSLNKKFSYVKFSKAEFSEKSLKENFLEVISSFYFFLGTFWTRLKKICTLYQFLLHRTIFLQKFKTHASRKKLHDNFFLLQKYLQTNKFERDCQVRLPAYIIFGSFYFSLINFCSCSYKKQMS